MIAKFILPHFIGLVCIVAGWYISIINVGLFKYNQEKSMHTKETIAGLILIVIGAYIPQIWGGIVRLMTKKKTEKTD
ncbi:MAG: hypothetical protein JJT78_00815 [Leptospira sp.]|nr:hypothetical protein [Leptospira sp.]